MKNVRFVPLLGCASLVAIMAGVQSGPAHAQSQLTTPATDPIGTPPAGGSVTAEPAAAAEAPAAAPATDIVVTGTRLISNGSTAPTPVTVLSTSQLTAAAPSTLVEALSQVPQFRGSTKPSSFNTPQGTVASIANLRGLSAANAPRTLVLFDGRRVNPVSYNGQVDLNTLPNLLLKRVDIVTGGASAAYGTDAVAGVVNYVLDRDFTGIKADVNASVSGQGDDAGQKVQFGAGTKLLDGKLHLMGSVEYYNSAGIVGERSRDWALRHCEAIQNPAYPSASSTNFLFRCGVTGTDLAPGGVVASGPLRGTQFLPGGVPAPYQYGSLVTNGSTMVGGDGVWIPRGNFSAPFRTLNAFGHVDYEVSDSLKLFAEANFSRVRQTVVLTTPYFSGSTDFTIFNDNAFLPAATKMAMAAAGVTSISVGRAGTDLPTSQATVRNHSKRGAFGFDGSVGDWQINGYADIGQTIEANQTRDNLIKSRAYQAADAVVNPATGQIVCRSTLTFPGDGCAPLNIFGSGSPSAAAKSYIFGESSYRKKSTQLATELAARGSPFSTWAGKVQVAAGLDYRRLTGEGTADLLSQTVVAAAPGSRGTPAAILNGVGAFLSGNTAAQPYAKYNVKEVFAEGEVPLARNVPFLQALDVNAAVRYAKYSTTGGVTSWKVGASWSPISDIRFRATHSRDVRAPNLLELYGPNIASLTTVFDPVTNASAQAYGVTGGNANLRPEFGVTNTVGVVLRPSFVRNLSFSVDYYDIRISGAIASLSALQIVNLCTGGNTSYCQFITRLPAPVNTITQVQTTLQNLNKLRSSGIDFELNYTTDLTSISPALGGRLSLRALVSYLQHLTTTDAFGTITEFAGVNGGELTASPKVQGTFSAAYTNGPVALYAQERFISAGHQANVNVPFTDSGAGSLDINHVPRRFYTDVTLSANVSKRLEIYTTINNLFDRDPPQAPTRTGQPTVIFPTNPTLYDLVGRNFTFGVRVRY